MGERVSWCDKCQNTGEIDCYCGGDLCVCENNGVMPCPKCDGGDLITDEIDDSTEPCTEAARDAGCTCRMSHTHSASIDPPHEIVDPWCPLHGGRDPDRERDERMDRDDDNRDWED